VIAAELQEERARGRVANYRASKTGKMVAPQIIIIELDLWLHLRKKLQQQGDNLNNNSMGLLSNEGLLIHSHKAQTIYSKMEIQ
jgi:hypothetical protein